MKNIIVALVLIFFPLVMKAQFAISLRDSKYVGVSYTYKEKYGVGLEHSVFSQEIETQYVRGYLNYTRSWTRFDLDAKLYYGTPYNHDYYNCGMMLSGRYKPFQSFEIMASANPHYDSYFDCEMCFEAGALVKLSTDIGLYSLYSTIPEFRQKENRVKVGLHLNVMNLSVSPHLSIPTEGPVKSVRLLVNCSYVFSAR